MFLTEVKLLLIVSVLSPPAVRSRVPTSANRDAPARTEASVKAKGSAIALLAGRYVSGSKVDRHLSEQVARV